jgi:hypothetical protein
MAIWYILWPFGTFCGSFGTFRGPFGTFCGHLVGTFCGHLVHIFPRFGMLYRQKSGNPASGPRGPPRFKSGEKKRLLLRGEKRRQLFFSFLFLRPLHNFPGNVTRTTPATAFSRMSNAVVTTPGETILLTKKVRARKKRRKKGKKKVRKNGEFGEEWDRDYVSTPPPRLSLPSPTTPTPSLPCTT